MERTTKTLAGGFVAIIEESRKTAIPKGLRGLHFNVIIEDSSGRRIKFGEEVENGTGAEAYDFLKKFVMNLAKEMGRPGGYRLSENGHDVCTNPDYHAHGMVIASSNEEIKAAGLQIVRIVDPASLFIPAGA